MFNISTNKDDTAGYEDAPAVTDTPAAMARTSLEAHEALMSISPENRCKFKDVVSFLKEDLEKVSPNAPS